MPLAITVENLPCIAICVASAMPVFLQFHSHTQKLEPSTLHKTTKKTKVKYCQVVKSMLNQQVKHLNFKLYV